MKTITYNNTKYKIAFVTDSDVVVYLPEKEIHGHVSRMTIPLKEFSKRIQTRIKNSN